MKHRAIYLDSGFYLITDKAAGELVRALGKKLPRPGYEMRVNLSGTPGSKPDYSALLIRTFTSMCKPTLRGWHWALYGFRAIPDAPRSMPAGEFTFHPSA